MKITLTNDDPIIVTVRWLGAAAIRDLARRAHCTIETERVGFFTRRFTIDGSREWKALFLELAWEHDLPGLRRAMMEQFE